MSSRVILKPSVYKYEDYWVSELDHISWVDRTDFNCWENAVDHALWLGLSAGVWAIE